MPLKKHTTVQTLFIIIFLMLAFLTWKFLGEHKKPLKKIKREVPPPLVITKKVFPQDITMLIRGYGTVKAIKKTTLSSEISGKVIYISPYFTKGSIIKKGELLIKIDPSDYKISLEISKNQVKIAENEFTLIQEESKQGIFEWNLTHPKEKVPPLVSRQPQLKSALSKLEEAKERVKKAELDLQRTLIKAPFNSIVLEKGVDVGSYLVQGKPIGTLVGTDEAEIYVPLSLEDVKWIDVPGFTVPQNHKGSKARLELYLGNDKIVRYGNVVRSEGILDENTRMLTVILRLKNPYITYPPFSFGSFVHVIFEGKRIPKAYVLPVEAIHEGSNIWIVKDERLYIKNIKVMRYMDNTAIISKGIKPGEEVVLSPLPYVTQGMRVRIQHYLKK